MTASAALNTMLSLIELDRPAMQLSNSDYETRQILTFLNEAGQDIARRAEWSRLFGEITVPGGSTFFPLPADFYSLPSMGAVRLAKAGFHPVKPVVQPELWEMLSRTPSATPHYYLRDGRIYFAPAVDLEGAVVRYTSKNWVEDRDFISGNGDNLHIPARLVAQDAACRWLRSKGMPFDDLQAQFEAGFAAEIQADRGRM